MTARSYDDIDAAHRELAIVTLKAQVSGFVQRRDDLSLDMIDIAKGLDELAVSMFCDRDPAEAWATWNLLAQVYRRVSENLNDQKRLIEGWTCALRELGEYGVTDV